MAFEDHGLFHSASSRTAQQQRDDLASGARTLRRTAGSFTPLIAQDEALLMSALGQIELWVPHLRFPLPADCPIAAMVGRAARYVHAVAATVHLHLLTPSDGEPYIAAVECAQAAERLAATVA